MRKSPITKAQLDGPLLLQLVPLTIICILLCVVEEKPKIPFLKCCLHKNQFLVVKIMFEEREEATQKHVLLQQRQLAVCKQVRKKILGK